VTLNYPNHPPPFISSEWMELDTSNLVDGLKGASMKGTCSGSRDLSKFLRPKSYLWNDLS